MHVSFWVYYCSAKNTREKRSRLWLRDESVRLFEYLVIHLLSFLPLTREKLQEEYFLCNNQFPSCPLWVFNYRFFSFHSWYFLIRELSSASSPACHDIFISGKVGRQKSRKRWWRNIQEEVVQAVVSYKTHQERDRNKGWRRRERHTRHGPRVRVREMKETTFLPIKHVIENH